MADDDGDLSFDERVAAAVQAQLTAERGKAERKARLDKLGLTDDVLSEIADAVWNRGEERAAARRDREDNAEQEPARGKPKPSGRNLFGLIPTGTDDDG